MSYSIKEIFYTLQGEGFHTGRPAVFIRFSGCNLWSGYAADRSTAICQFCDTDFVGTNGRHGGKYEQPRDLVRIVKKLWPRTAENLPFIVCTGGEPLLQLDSELIDAFHSAGFEIAIETNGTLPIPAHINWTCVSPKAGSELNVSSGDELKLIFPQPGLNLEQMLALDFEFFSLQPMDGPKLNENIIKTVQYCLKHPQWHLSLQTHKLIGLP
jgi:7-carboxy-7-deazaguanine synthase (Cx14CxxC type)